MREVYVIQCERAPGETAVIVAASLDKQRAEDMAKRLQAAIIGSERRYFVDTLPLV